MGKGVLERPLEVASADPKSIGHSTTLPKDIWKREELTSCILRLCGDGRRARRYGYKGKRITLTVRYPDFKTFTKQTTLTAPTNDTGEVYRAAVSILDTNSPQEKRQALRRLPLVPIGKWQALPLFGQAGEDKKTALAKAVDAVNDGTSARTPSPTPLPLSRKKDRRLFLRPGVRQA